VLARSDAAWIELARSLLPFLDRGRVDAGPDGTGVRWRVGDPSINACSTGPVGLLAVRLSRHEPDPSRREALVELGRATRRFIARRLTRPDGLVGDRREPDGSLEPTVWSYNQGAAMALVVALAELGEPERLDDARALAARTLDHLAPDDGLWRQPPAFNGVFLRELLTLHDHDGDPGWTEVVDRYLDRAWREGLLPSTGLVGAGGIGRYDDGYAMDHAALVQLWSLRAVEGKAA